MRREKSWWLKQPQISLLNALRLAMSHVFAADSRAMIEDADTAGLWVAVHQTLPIIHINRDRGSP